MTTIKPDERTQRQPSNFEGPFDGIGAGYSTLDVGGWELDVS